MDIWQLNDSQVAAILRSTSDRVELWSSHRLPFEPKGVLLQVRNQIRIPLRKLAAKSDCVLEARYVSTIKQFVDTENVLIYNVGTSAFASASRNGLRFVRDFSEPPPDPNDNSHWRHYQSYSVIPRGLADCCATPPAQFRFQLGKLSTSLKPHDYWWATKSGLGSAEFPPGLLSGPYKLTIKTTGPPFRGNYAACVKPLFDGVISALHYDPSVDSHDPVSKLIAMKLNVSSSQVTQHLCDSTNAILGPRRVVSQYREYVKWNPADEICLIGELYPQHVDSTNWSIDVSISPADDSSEDADWQRLGTEQFSKGYAPGDNIYYQLPPG